MYNSLLCRNFIPTLKNNFKSSALQKEGIDLNTAVHLLESLREYVQGLRDRYSAFEDEAKEITEQENYARDNRRGRQRKRFHDEIGDEVDALEEVSAGESYRINNYLPIIDSLTSALSKRIAAYSGLSEKFSFFAQLGVGKISDDNLRSAAKHLVNCYPEDLEPELELELVHFNAFLKGLRNRGALSRDKISEIDMLQLIIDNAGGELFANVSIALKLYLCMFVTNCKGERSFSKLKLILSYLRNCMGQKRLASLAILSIESQLSRNINFSSLIDAFAAEKARRKTF